MADNKLTMGPDAWARQEEEMARKQADLRAQGLDSCDVGFGPTLLRAHDSETLRKTLIPVVAELAEGMFVLNFDGRRVYVYRRRKAADIMLRDEAVAWFGEAVVAKIDALIGG